jgi:hypothetical protein
MAACWAPGALLALFVEAVADTLLIGIYMVHE